MRVYTAVQGLEALHRKYQAKGFKVLGFPCNDFGAQEPGTNEEIKTFCSSNYDVTFPLFDKLHVKGPEQHPLYAALTGKQSPRAGRREMELWQVPGRAGRQAHPAV